MPRIFSLKHCLILSTILSWMWLKGAPSCDSGKHEIVFISVWRGWQLMIKCFSKATICKMSLSVHFMISQGVCVSRLLLECITVLIFAAWFLLLYCTYKGSIKTCQLYQTWDHAKRQIRMTHTHTLDYKSACIVWSCKLNFLYKYFRVSAVL